MNLKSFKCTIFPSVNVKRKRSFIKTAKHRLACKSLGGPQQKQHLQWQENPRAALRMRKERNYIIKLKSSLAWPSHSRQGKNISATKCPSVLDANEGGEREREIVKENQKTNFSKGGKERDKTRKFVYALRRGFSTLKSKMQLSNKSWLKPKNQILNSNNFTIICIKLYRNFT